MPGSDSESYLVLIRLRPIKEALQNDTWIRRKEKILATTDRVIREALSSDDAFTIHGEETCMVALAKTTKEQAEATAYEISDRIVRGLFGDFGATTFPLEPTIMAIRDLLNQVGGGDSGALLQDIINNHGGTLPAPDDAEHLEAMRKEAQKASRRRKLQELFEPEGPAEITYEYRPVWRADDQTVDRFRYVPVLQRSAAERLFAYDVLGPSYTEADIVDLDVSSVENAVIDIKQAVDAGHDVKLSLRVHFATAGSSLGRTELTKSLAVVPQSFRQRITFTLEDIPEGIPEARLHGIVDLLKPYSASRSVIFNAFPTNVQVFKNLLNRVRATGIDTIGIRVPRNATSRDTKALCSIVPQVSNLGLKVMGYGVTSGEDVVQLVSAGFVGLAGPVFGGPFAELPAPYSLPVNRLCDLQGKRMGSSFFYA